MQNVRPFNEAKSSRQILKSRLKIWLYSGYIWRVFVYEINQISCRLKLKNGWNPCNCDGRDACFKFHHVGRRSRTGSTTGKIKNRGTILTQTWWSILILSQFFNIRPNSLKLIKLTCIELTNLTTSLVGETCYLYVICNFTNIPDWWRESSLFILFLLISGCHVTLLIMSWHISSQVHANVGNSILTSRVPMKFAESKFQALIDSESILLSSLSILRASQLDRDTLSRKRQFSRSRDLERFKRCHMASENFDAELLLNIRVSV